jgi:transposase InsO family protein
LRRPESKHGADDRRLSFHVRVVHEESRRTYGSPRVWRALQGQGIAVGRHRVARLMRVAGIRARKRRKYLTTTNSNHDNAVAANLLQRSFDADRPNAIWASDITYLATAQGWIYLAVVVDLFSRRVVGWALSDRIDAQLAVEALRMALLRRSPLAGLLHHSDRGLQYASFEYQELLRKNAITCSMSRIGDCWDNAVVESFFSTMKTELAMPNSEHRDNVRNKVIDYIENFYNTKRLHSTLGYVSPSMFEAREVA